MGERTGARPRHRAPVRHKPSSDYVWAAILLAATFGLLTAAITEALTEHRHGWAGFFIAAAILDVIVYFYVVRCWVRLVI